ncbi:MAG: hypothetical protein DRO06_03415 [Thermoproteota archaeon]|nr:MAG: hypothetical protein DRO06_03415 [Candidatus Korarchaeota archaeon]
MVLSVLSPADAGPLLPVRLVGAVLFFCSAVLAASVHRSLPERHDRPEDVGRLITEGPYSLVRHPFYLFSALVGVGAAAYSLRAWAAALALASAALWASAAVLEERELRRAWPEYREYAERVPMFVPRIRPLGTRRRTFLWRRPSLSRMAVPRPLSLSVGEAGRPQADRAGRPGERPGSAAARTAEAALEISVGSSHPGLSTTTFREGSISTTARKSSSSVSSSSPLFRQTAAISRSAALKGRPALLSLLCSSAASI